MNTDIDRLHNVVDGTLKGQQVGKTFAKCHEVAGLVELGFTDIYCIVREYKDIEYIMLMVYGVFLDHDLDTTFFQLSTQLYSTAEINIRFIPESKLYTTKACIDGSAVVDMLDE